MMKMMNHKIAVLIPCYNEELTIAKVIEDFHEQLPSATIYVYDNNSTDRTVEIASSYSFVVVRHEYKQGKGNVVRRMFREVNADCYIMVDGDDTYPAENSKQMCDLVINKQIDMVVGDRLSSTYFTENKRLFHNFGNSLVRFLINKLFKSNIKDIMTGYRAFSYNFVKTFPIISRGFEIETEMSIHAIDKNLSIENVIVDYRDRPDGSESKLSTISDGFKVIRMIVRLLSVYRPLLFFWIISFIFLSVGIFLLIYILNNFQLIDVPTIQIIYLLILLFAFLTSIVSFFVGVLLNIFSYKNKCDYEMYLHQSSQIKAFNCNNEQ